MEVWYLIMHLGFWKKFLGTKEKLSFDKQFLSKFISMAYPISSFWHASVAAIAYNIKLHLAKWLDLHYNPVQILVACKTIPRHTYFAVADGHLQMHFSNDCSYTLMDGTKGYDPVRVIQLHDHEPVLSSGYRPDILHDHKIRSNIKLCTQRRLRSVCNQNWLMKCKVSWIQSHAVYSIPLRVGWC